jgi:hypothetical protein
VQDQLKSVLRLRQPESQALFELTNDLRDWLNARVEGKSETIGGEREFIVFASRTRTCGKSKVTTPITATSLSHVFPTARNRIQWSIPRIARPISVRAPTTKAPGSSARYQPDRLIARSRACPAFPGNIRGEGFPDAQRPEVLYVAMNDAMIADSARNNVPMRFKTHQPKS